MSRTIKHDPGADPRLPMLTLRQPWAGLVAKGIKRVENRGWRPGDWLLGRDLAIHAGQSFDKRWCDVEDMPGARTQARIGYLNQLNAMRTDALDPGRATGVIGVVKVRGWVDCRPGAVDPHTGRVGHSGRIIDNKGRIHAATPDQIRRVRSDHWSVEGQVWWVLNNARCVTQTIPQRGWPGLHRLDINMEARLRAALEEGRVR